MSKKIAIIGLGNTLRRDDGIGIVVLKSLLNFHKKKGVDYLNFGIASFDLLHRMKDYDAVLLIDGIDARLQPGEFKIFKLDDIEYNSDDFNPSPHEVNLKNIFDLYKKLNLKTKIYVAGIQVEDISYAEGLTDMVENNKETIIKEINSFVESTLF